MTTSRPLVLDIGCAGTRGATPADMERVALLMAHLPQALLHGRAGAASRRTAAAGPPTLVAPLRRWLIGEADRPEPVPGRPALRRRVPPWPTPRAPIPDGAALILPTLAAWDPAMAALLASRPDIRPVAMLDRPLALDWPEYVSADETATLPGALVALGRHAACVIAPDEATARRLSPLLGAERLCVEPRPSALAGSPPPAFDPVLGAARYVMACGPIEARSNALLLLQIWREAVATGDAMPRLILAGERGAQIEDIRPMLDWNRTLRSHVAEAPRLPTADLRILLAHAQALLAPDFAGVDDALLRDARACGVPVVTAGPAGDAGDRTIDPIDGRGWRDAAKTTSRPPWRSTAVRLIDWPDYAARIAARAQGA